ncbi:MAG: hypothetical protein OXF84_14525 [Bacteroidetes bacterium]|nr:hypothetical protein [Bacteroidota bacterium]
MYHLVGKQVRVHLYTKDAMAIGTIEGRVADVAAKVEVAPGIKKDLALVVDIHVPSEDSEPYVNSGGIENEGWFAVQDIQVLDEDLPAGWFSN